MSLTNRLMLFFLGTLALVLVGFSGALYLFAHAYLQQQADERLEAAANTLVAAVEVTPEVWKGTQNHTLTMPRSSHRIMC